MDGTERHRGTKKRTTRIKRSDVAYFLIITLVCLVVALMLAFITGRMPSLLDEVRQTKDEREYIEKLQEIEHEAVRKYGKEKIDDLIREYGDKGEKTR